MLEEFKESLERAPIIKKGDYDYFVHPITDGIPALEPKLVNELAYAVSKIINPDTEKIVTVEAMGIPIATALSLKINKPFC
ncbi:MAG: adenine phosphoribosyltransferase, partial [Candidatus Thermoplasmatota archaeon]